MNHGTWNNPQRSDDWRTGIITRKERKHEQHMEIAKAA